MEALLNATTSHEPSADRLKSVYSQGLIAPEKKPFLIDLQRSKGPYLAVNGGGMICDGASQIASLGLGFNPGPQFGAAHHFESWTNQLGTPGFRRLRDAYASLLSRKLGSDAFQMQFCASGAEANETVLGSLFQARRSPDARHVLAFEGSFHGRMMVTLASTWNPPKREPFTWPGHESVFAPYPVMQGEDVHAPREPEDWSRAWSTTDDEVHRTTIEQFSTDADGLLSEEIESLNAVRGHLKSGKVFAILIEPMQCEGGDRYSSRRFHQGLALLSEAFGVPLVFDEIQTGFGLGTEFFWHRKYCLQRADGSPFFPAGVVCAKKSQAGVAIVNSAWGELHLDPASKAEQTSAASIARGYAQASVLDQFYDRIVEIELASRERLNELAQRYPNRISHPRAQGMSFAFDLESTDDVGRFVGQRFQHGLLYYPAGAKTARFRMNLGFRPADSELFWRRLESALEASFDGREAAASAATPNERREAHYDFHQIAVENKLAVEHGTDLEPTKQTAVDWLTAWLSDRLPESSFKVVLLNRENFPDYRDRVLAMQSEVYEPARQSTAEEFEAAVDCEAPLAILVLRDDEIIAMSFAGPLANFPEVRGTETDPYREDPTVYYSVDLTVAEPYRGGLGRAMKQAITLLAHASGVTAIHGRNRDRLARGMWAINLSLGAYELKHLPQDYPDAGSHRDCIYYRQETRWSPPPIDLSSGIEAPLGPAAIDIGFVDRNLPALVNKLTLSNFVTAEFLEDLEQAAFAWPKSLRKLYTASGLSEAVDKIAKVLWTHRKPRTGLLTIEGCDFGSGSFLARSLSGVGDAFFDVERLPEPNSSNADELLAALRDKLAEDRWLGVFVEPLRRRTMSPIEEDLLRRLVATCREHDTPVVFNDTAGLFYRYSPEAFAPSGVEGLTPDAAIAYLGGQTALVGASEALFLDQPLLLISTWDGDALSLAQFSQAMRLATDDPTAFAATVDAFHSKLIATIKQQPGATACLRRGVGSVTGAIDGAVADMLRRVEDDRWVCCPSLSEMQRFNAVELSV